MLSEKTQTYSTPCDKCDSFGIMTVVNRIQRWPYELKDLFIEKLLIVQRVETRLFYSMTVDTEKEFLKS